MNSFDQSAGVILAAIDAVVTDPTDRLILTVRLRLHPELPFLSLRELGRTLGLSRERIRQRENRALRLLWVALGQGPSLPKAVLYREERRVRRYCLGSRHGNWLSAATLKAAIPAARRDTFP